MPWNLPTMAEVNAVRRAQPKPRSSKLEKHEAKQAKERDDVKLRKVIRARDKDTCRCCGKPCAWDAPSFATRAHVHHLVFRSASKSLQDAPSNLILLCGFCHAKVHSRELVVIGEDAAKPVLFRKPKKDVSPTTPS